ncbi:MAG: AraC family ligand binding domain-containing protein [Planctomycetota bacterium]|jgi:quercetin dioxygenase-like cupin family protein
MGEFKLEDIVSFSEENTVSTSLYDSQKACASLLCMEAGQSALQDTKDQKVIVVVNSGSGSVVTDGGEHDVEEGTFVLFESGESCTLKAKTKLTALVTIISKG